MFRETVYSPTKVPQFACTQRMLMINAKAILIVLLSSAKRDTFRMNAETLHTDTTYSMVSFDLDGGPLLNLIFVAPYS